MSAEVNESTDRMEKINVRVPKALLEEIETEWKKRGYSNKSEAIRDALRDWINPPVTLSEETLGDLQESRKQVEQEENHSLEEVAAKFDANLDEGE